MTNSSPSHAKHQEHSTAKKAPRDPSRYLPAEIWYQIFPELDYLTLTLNNASVCTRFRCIAKHGGGTLDRVLFRESRIQLTSFATDTREKIPEVGDDSEGIHINGSLSADVRIHPLLLALRFSAEGLSLVRRKGRYGIDQLPFMSDNLTSPPFTKAEIYRYRDRSVVLEGLGEKGVSVEQVVDVLTNGSRKSRGSVRWCFDAFAIRDGGMGYKLALVAVPYQLCGS